MRVKQTQDIIDAMDNIRRMFSGYRVDNNLGTNGLYFEAEEKIYDALDLMQKEVLQVNEWEGFINDVSKASCVRCS